MQAMSITMGASGKLTDLRLDAASTTLLSGGNCLETYFSDFGLDFILL
jgi:hypothetical protein